jgi:hypothetical protein
LDLEKINEKEIQNRLKRKFDSHKYIRSNSYVFDWESDFFSKTASGYFQEIEIKISLSDFKADFKNKTHKHDALSRKFKGIDTYITHTENTYQIEYDEMESVVIDGKRQYNEDGTIKEQFKRKMSREIKSSPKMLKSWSKYYKNNFKATQTSSIIEIKQLPKIPHKFYYICPENLIPIELIPEYAGLYYINENQIREMKKAPFIHKEEVDLTQTLLDKFYYKSLKCD